MGRDARDSGKSPEEDGDSLSAEELDEIYYFDCIELPEDQQEQMPCPPGEIIVSYGCFTGCYCEEYAAFYESVIRVLHVIARSLKSEVWVGVDALALFECFLEPIFASDTTDPCIIRESGASMVMEITQACNRLEGDGYLRRDLVANDGEWNAFYSFTPYLCHFLRAHFEQGLAPPSRCVN